MVQSDREFLKGISKPELVNEYKTKKQEISRELNGKYKEKEGRALQSQSRRDAIDREREHRDLVNLSTFPFTDGGTLIRTGYQFVRASPLHELKKPNLDFLLFKPGEKMNFAIFGECKSSATTPGDVVSQTRHRMRVVDEEVDHIKKDYLHLKKGDRLTIEYVISAEPFDANRILAKIIDSNGGIIVWCADRQRVSISALCAPKKVMCDPDSLQHRDRDLRRALLSPAHSSLRCFDLFPEIIRSLELSSIVKAASELQNELILTKEMIRGYLSRELYYVDAKEIDGLVDSIIQDAVDIGALEYVAGEKHFRLRVSNTNRKSAEQKIENKWIDNQIDKAFYDERTKRMTALQEDIMRRDTRYPTLSEFI